MHLADKNHFCTMLELNSQKSPGEAYCRSQSFSLFDGECCMRGVFSVNLKSVARYMLPNFQNTKGAEFLPKVAKKIRVGEDIPEQLFPSTGNSW